MRFEAVQPFLPDGDMAVYPRLGLLKRMRVYLARPYAAYLLGADKAALFKDTDMLEQRRQSQIERLGKFADGFRSLAQPADDCPARGVCQCGKGLIEID